MKYNKLGLIFVIILAVLITGCNMPQSQEESVATDDLMATEIARILTGTPGQPVQPTPTLRIIEETTPPPQITEETVETVVVPTNTSAPEQPTATPEPTSAPTQGPTATLSDTDPALTLGTADWVDTMDNGDNWPTGYSEYTTIDFDNGYLKMTADTDLDGWRLSWPFLDDFYLEATLQSPDCEGSDHFGLIFRVPSNSNANKGYLFGITCDGRFSLRRWDGKNMVYPINWTESTSINQGANAVNVLGVMAKGANLAFYINGQKVQEVSDNAYLEGLFGIFVGGTNTEDLTVWVNQVRYWENP